MEKEYTIEDIKQLNTKKLLKLFPKVLKIKEQDFDSLLYVTGLVLALEKTLTIIIAGGIKSGITKELRNPNMIEFIIDELTLNAKVKIIKKLVESDPIKNVRYKKFLNYLFAVNDLRNQIFHGKLTNLEYREKSICDVTVQHKMLLDYIEAAKEATGRF